VAESQSRRGGLALAHPWGAAPDQWHHLDLSCGLVADLLPVVSNPNAKISASSKMKGLGKTPSRYNQAGEVAGIKDWTSKQTTPAEIEKWSQQGDYGICIQTRQVRGLDIDVPDRELAQTIAQRFLALLGRRSLPARGRANSGKVLLGFRLPGDFRKRSFRVEGGLVEFLANGQQFVAVGTHPSGARYEWAGGLPADFPEISAEDFERAWAALVAEFAIEPERRARERVGSGQPGQDATPDATADWLEANWETYGSDGEKLFLLCPFKDGHSGDSGETEAAWLLAGTSGYERGHFACLHASCSGRTDGEFLRAVGMPATDKADFPKLAAPKAQALAVDDLAAEYAEIAASLPRPEKPASTGLKKTAAHPTGVEALPLPGFERNKQGGIRATLGNVVTALQEAQVSGHLLRHDKFRGELVITSVGGDTWEPFTDAHAVALRMALVQHHQWGENEPVGKEMMRDALTKVAADNEFDSATEWLERLPAWDGVERIESFYPTYFRTADTPYARACGLYVWTGHAGRVLVPGIKADMATILVGPQGCGKSRGVAAMSPHEDFFTEFDMETKDADLARKMRSTLVGELGELRGMSVRDADAMKAWVSKRFEKWTPKYVEYETSFPRRLLFHGTTNVDDFLNDPTGERRWLPMRVALDRNVDVEAIERDRDQLWAEGAARFKADGIAFAKAEELARAEHHQFRARDPWEGPLSRWLDAEETDGSAPRYAPNGVTSEVILTMCLGIEAARVQKRDEMRLASVLKALGMVRDLRRIGGTGKPTRVWVDANSDLG